VATNPVAKTLGYVLAIQEGHPEQIPAEFRQYLGIMSKEAADKLPEHRPYDCKIDLKEGSTAPWGPIYPLSEKELQVLREWLKEMEKTGKIQRSTSSAGSPILFVPKPNGTGLRLCVDYRGLNKITVPNRYPLPLMQELQDRVQGVSRRTSRRAGSVRLDARRRSGRFCSEGFVQKVLFRRFCSEGFVKESFVQKVLFRRFCYRKFCSERFCLR
jgi:hypothetical protein